jgi:ERF superfamily
VVNRSDSLQELAAALSKAQRKIEGAKKDSKNPHYGSKYASLKAVWDAIGEPFGDNGLSVMQFPRLVSLGENTWMVEVETFLLHDCGQFISDVLAVPLTRVDAQGVGSAISYARRYALMAVAGVAPEDDDANAAVGASGEAKPSRAKKAEPEFATVKVLGITQRPSGPDTKYVISCDDKNTYQTFLKAHAESAKSAQQAGVAVKIQYRQDSFGRSVISLEEVTAEEPPV